MSLAYPIARSLEEATRPGAKIARSKSEAAGQSPGFAVEGLETSWLHLTEAEASALVGAQGADGPAGHIHRYEDTSGHVVVAVSWWKLVLPGQKSAPAKATETEVPMPPAPAPVEKPDHTDDLYFRRGRTKVRRKKPVDPNQLDLFQPSGKS
ncbi:MAG: hypothetical protein RLO80_04220 [Hyphomonas sp.]